ncbi:MAG TPA: class I SAM-dependent methyltransferase [Crenalkalicoccus sp.]|jgi:SAM-dependent methyltransferase|nr:class I SAM-dependent methyltransferase [Crenalkalicoccus sp.]
MRNWLYRVLHPRTPTPAEAELAAQREAALLRRDVKVLATELARQRYAAGLAGHAAPLPAAPVPAALTSRICRQADIEQDWLRHWCGRLRMAPLYHRKVWEDCFILQAVWEAGLLRPGARALGFAVGAEWLPAFLAGQGLSVVATDLDPGDARAGEWIRSGQHAAAAERLYQAHLCDRADFAARVGFRPVDMSAIPDDLARGGFDLVWSVCALEHLGTLQAGADFVRNAMRCLRPGGLAVHTTEYNLDAAGPTLERGGTVLFQRRHLEALTAALAAEGHAMLPLDDAPGEAVFDRFVDLPPYPHEADPLGPLEAPHLRLSLEGFPATSVGLIVRAGP